MPETRGKSLEEIDSLFGAHHKPPTSATPPSDAESRADSFAEKGESEHKEKV